MLRKWYGVTFWIINFILTLNLFSFKYNEHLHRIYICLGINFIRQSRSYKTMYKNNTNIYAKIFKLKTGK